MLKAQRRFVLWDVVAGSQCLQSPGWERQGERLRTAGFKKPLLLPPVTFASVFKAALRLTPWILCALVAAQRKYLSLKDTSLPCTSVSDFRSEWLRNTGLRSMYSIYYRTQGFIWDIGSGFRCVRCSTK